MNNDTITTVQEIENILEAAVNRGYQRSARSARSARICAQNSDNNFSYKNLDLC